MDNYVFAARFPIPLANAGIPCQPNLDIEERVPVSARLSLCKLDAIGLTVHNLNALFISSCVLQTTKQSSSYRRYNKVSRYTTVPPIVVMEAIARVRVVRCRTAIPLDARNTSRTT